MPPVPTTVAPTLSDGTVTLRPVNPDDIAAVVEQSLDPETVRWTTVPPNYTEACFPAFADAIGLFRKGLAEEGVDEAQVLEVLEAMGRALNAAVRAP